MSKSWVGSLVAVAVLLFSGPVLAHHGDSGRYESNDSTVAGTVVDFQFVNPHTIIVFETKDEDGKVARWQGELGAPTSLRSHAGWTKDTLKPGDKITVIGRRLKNGSNYILLNDGKIIATDTGKELFHGGGGQQAAY